MGLFFKNKKGQITVEYLLLAVVVLVLSRLAFNTLKNGDYLDDFVSGPNQYIARMLENGNWQISTQDSKADHPNHTRRHLSWDP